MAKKIQKKEEDYYEVIDTVLPIIEREEETYNLDEKDINILPQGSIKYELNLIEFPIFSKDKKVKENTSRKYVFSEKNNEYLEVIPSANQDHITKKILQEFDEQIFYGLMRIYEETGNRQIISNYPELLKISGIEYKTDNLLRIKDSLERMKGCSIIFNSCFFLKEKSENIRRTKEINLISSLDIISITDKEAKSYKEHFEKHGNLKEIFVAILNEDIVKNLDNKLHKYFKIEELTEIRNATARKIYVMLTKWRHWQKDNPMRRTTKFLASRIPLSWKKTNVPQTIRSIEKACEELKKLKKIKEYRLNKEGKLEESTIDFYFEERKDVLELLNGKIGIEETGHETMEILEVKETEIKEIETAEKVYSEEVERLYEKIKEIERIESLKDVIEESVEAYGIERVESNIKYSNDNSKTNYTAFFKKALKEDYARIEREKELKKAEIKKKQQQLEEMKRKREEEEKKLTRKLAEEIYETKSEEEIEEYLKNIPKVVKKSDFFDKKEMIILKIIEELEQ